MITKYHQHAAKKSLILSLFIAIAISTAWARADQENILHNFASVPHGADPQSNLIADALGNLYGTTEYGGRYGYGEVFTLTPSAGKWKETVIYSFRGAPVDGAFPLAGLTFDADGNLYGTTSAGEHFQACDYSCGTVFKLSFSSGRWSETVIYSFSGKGRVLPVGSLVFDHAGNLYGVTSQGGAFRNGSIFELSPAVDGSWTESTLYSFTGNSDGGSPWAGLIVDARGNLYGTTRFGGDSACDSGYNDSGCGVVFQLTNSGKGSWTESVLYAFTLTLNDGGLPQASLVFDKNGNLYGTTTVGGSGAPCAEGCGTVFEVTPGANGNWTETVLYNFQGGTDGLQPVAGLVIDASANLYGTTMWGGSTSCSSGCGTVFELTQGSNGSWNEKVLQRFTLPAHGPNDGIYPVSGLLLDQAGNLYGTAVNGGDQNCANFEGCGTVFELSPASGGNWTLTMLYAFNTGSLGWGPAAGVISDSQGTLFGTAQGGGSHNYGVAFELITEPDGSRKEVLLHDFRGGKDGAHPGSPLIFDAAGNLYGTTTNGGSQECSGDSECGGIVFELSPTGEGWQETVIHRFGNLNNLGLLAPMPGLAMDSAGNLYGVTPEIGSTNCRSEGCGTVYRLSSDGLGKWHKDVLYRFQGGQDGEIPLSTLIFDSEHNLYGTTCGGGSWGNGTVFKLAPVPDGKWKESVLYSFQGAQNGDGSCPFAGVVSDDKGNLFGTTYQGGNITHDCSNDGCGIVFELSPVGGVLWKETVLFAFQGSDGSSPNGPLTFDSAGNLYGVAAPRDALFPHGVLFKLSPGSKGWTETVLHQFGAGLDGIGPSGPLIFDGEGNIYGTTTSGGTDGSGTVFRLSSGGVEEQENEFYPTPSRKMGTIFHHNQR